MIPLNSTSLETSVETYFQQEQYFLLQIDLSVEYSEAVAEPELSQTSFLVSITRGSSPNFKICVLT